MYRHFDLEIVTMKILIASSIDPEAIATLEEVHDVVSAFKNVTDEMLRELIRDREVLVFRSGVSITAALMECAPGLKLLVRAGSGMDNLDLDYVRRRGLELVRIPQPSARAVAEMTFGFMLALSRRMLEADRSMRAGRWEKHELSGYLLQGKTLGVIGVGNIGMCVAEIGIALGMKVIGCVEHVSEDRIKSFREKGVEILDFEEVVSTADYVSVHVPLKEETRFLMDSHALDRMKPDAYLINLARGGIVDEVALHHLLARGMLRGAALDVHAREGDGMLSPLADLPNVILTPHIGAMAVDTQRDIGRRVINIVNTYAGTNLVTAPGGEMYAEVTRPA